MLSGSCLAAPRLGRGAQAVPVVVRSRCFRAARVSHTSGHRQAPRTPRLRLIAPHAVSVDKSDDAVSITIDNEASDEHTVVTVQGANKAGLLMAVSGLFRDLGIEVTKANVETAGGLVNDTFYVVDSSGSKVTSVEDISMLRSVLRNLASSRPGRALSRPEFENITSRKKAVINNLMGARPPVPPDQQAQQLDRSCSQAEAQCRPWEGAGRGTAVRPCFWQCSLSGLTSHRVCRSRPLQLAGRTLPTGCPPWYGPTTL